MPHARKRWAAGLAFAALSAAAAPASAAILPQNFQESVAIGALKQPTAVRFAADGRVFVAEKSGIIKVYDSLADTTPTVFADLSVNVMAFWDRGLLGMALHPSFPQTPYVYVLYTYDAPVGGTAPVFNDACADPTGVGCVVSGRLSRLEMGAAGIALGPETVLIQNEWCQQYPSHSIGNLAFGADGALYVSAGDGASFNFTDHGQQGGNPCNDPLIPNSSINEGGALRSLDILTTSSTDATAFNGTILRVDPMTGGPMADNPLVGNAIADDDRIVAYGLRNPFRINVRPGTNEVWIGDVGWNTWEEVNRVVDPVDSVIENFGWPCYEGAPQQSSYKNEAFCQGVYNGTIGPGQVTSPYFGYKHGQAPNPGLCGTAGSSSITGIAFYGGGTYPNAYDGALFFSDYSRRCVWAMLEGANGLPDPTNITTLVGSAEDPVDLVVGPGGDLYYVDHSPSDSNGAVRRIQFFSTNQPPTAVLSASATNGAAPLAVQFDGAGSTDPDPGDALTYAWDLDGDGAFDDSTSATPTFVYAAPGNYTVSLQVTDGEDATSVAQVVISADNTPPTPTILSPINADTWAVGDTIALEGEGSDTQDGALGGAAMTWDVVLYHCPDDCHQHPLSTISGQSSASFVAPDHEYPSYLEVHLTVTDSLGLTGTTSVILEAEATELTFETVPAGLEVTVGASSFTAPVEVPLIIGSLSSISVASPQELGGVSYVFDSWSDGGPQTHNVVAPAAPASFTVTFAVDGDEDGVADGDDVCPVIPDPDQLDSDADGRGDACDNCIDDANADQADGDTDLTGDVCDNCLEVANADQADGDGDDDGDLCDNCVDEPNADQADGDDDGIGDACEQSGQGGAGGTGGAGGGGGRGSGGAATGGAAAGGAASAGAGTGGSTSATATGTGGKEEPDPDGDEGCGCRVAGAPAGSSHAGVALLGLLALSLKRLRRRGGARRARSMLAGR